MRSEDTVSRQDSRVADAAGPISRVRTLSVAAPAYNEAKVLPQLLEHWLSFLRSRRYRQFEIVICNDGSADDSAQVLSDLAAKNPELRVVTHPANQGAGAAMASAIRATRFDWVFLLDADGQFPIESLDALESELNRSAVRAVFGARERKADSLFARAGSHASGVLLNQVCGTHWRDFNSTCRLIEGPLLRSLPLVARGLNYSTEIAARLAESNVAAVETSIEHRPRSQGRSSRTAVRSTVDRVMFVSYLAMRRLLLAQKVIRLDAADDVPADRSRE